MQAYTHKYTLYRNIHHDYSSNSNIQTHDTKAMYRYKNAHATYTLSNKMLQHLEDTQYTFQNHLKKIPKFHTKQKDTTFFPQ